MGFGPAHHEPIYAGPLRAYVGWSIMGLAQPVPPNLTGPATGRYVEAQPILSIVDRPSRIYYSVELDRAITPL